MRSRTYDTQPSFKGGKGRVKRKEKFGSKLESCSKGRVLKGGQTVGKTKWRTREFVARNKKATGSGRTVRV